MRKLIDQYDFTRRLDKNVAPIVTYVEATLKDVLIKYARLSSPQLEQLSISTVIVPTYLVKYIVR